MKLVTIILNSFLLTIIGLTLAMLPVSEVRAQANAEQRRLEAQAQSQGQSTSETALPTNIPRSAEESATGVYYDSEGYAVQTRKTETKPLPMSADFLYLVMMLGIGAFIGRLIKYPEKTTDTWIAVAASAIMVGATIMAIMGSKKDIHAGEYKIDVREDGTVNNMQADAIREQIKSYRELESLAGKKWKIEAAGAAAYFGASAYALMKHMRAGAALQACSDALYAAIGTFSPVCSSMTPAAPEACRQLAACNAATAQLNVLNADFIGGPTEPSMTAGMRIRTESMTAIQATALCTPAAPLCSSVITSEVSLNLTYGDPSIIEAAITQNDPQAPFIDAEILRFVDQGHHQELWNNRLEFDSPYKNLFVSIKPEVFEQGLSILSPTLRSYEQDRFANGELSSIEVNDLKQYISLSHSYSYSRLNRLNTRNQNMIKSLIAQHLISSANAWSAKEFGLAGGAAVAYYTATKSNSRWLDSMLATPKWRSVVFGIAGTVAAATAVISKKTEGTMGENAEKLEALLADVLKLQNMPGVYTSPGQQSPGVQTSLAPTQIQSPQLATGTVQAPCLRDEKGCVKLESEIKADPGITDFGSTMSNLASLSGKVADGVMGSDSLSEGTMSDVEALAAQQGAVNKLSKRTAEALNKKLKEAGKDPVDLDALTDSALRSLQAATIRSLKNNPEGRDSLASTFGMKSLAIPGSGRAAVGDLERDEAVESALAEGGGPTGVGAAGTGNGFDFNFDFDDEVADSSNAYGDTLGLMGDMVDLQDYEAIDDIVSNRDVSLFQIITVRYFKSGFPRLFEIEE
jgi:hypothetical protein